MSGIEQPTAIEIADGVRKGELSAREVVDDYLGRIDAGNGALNAFVHVDAAGARDQADRVDARVAAGRTPDRSPAFPSGSKTWSIAPACRRPTGRRCTPIEGRWRPIPSTSPGCAPPAESRWARRRRPSSAR